MKWNEEDSVFMCLLLFDHAFHKVKIPSIILILSCKLCPTFRNWKKIKIKIERIRRTTKFIFLKKINKYWAYRMPKSAKIMGLWQLVERILKWSPPTFSASTKHCKCYVHLIPSVYFLSPFPFPSSELEKIKNKKFQVNIFWYNS